MTSEVNQQSKPDKRATFNRLQLLFGLIFLPIFIILGFWQLDRASFKESRQSEYEAAPRQLSDAGDASQLLGPRTLQPVKAIISGSDQRYFLLDNRTYEGRAGYEVIAPVRIGESWLLANLGWVRADPDRRILPKLDFAFAEYLDVEGVLTLPENLIQLAESSTEGASWPQRIQKVDLVLAASLLGFKVEPVVMKVYSDIVDGIVPHEAALNSMPPERHIGYAVQWFGLAIAMLIWLAVSLYISRREN